MVTTDPTEDPDRSPGLPTATDVIDDFDDQSLSEYTGDTGDWSFSTTSNQGTHSITTTVTTGTLISSSSGLDNYPARGDVFTYDVRGDANENARSFMHFFITGSGDKYSVLIRFDVTATDHVRLRRDSGGTITNIATGVSGGTLGGATWYTVEVDTTATGSNTIAVDVVDQDGNSQGTLSADDGNVNGTNFGWGHNTAASSAQTWFDNATMGGL